MSGKRHRERSRGWLRRLGGLRLWQSELSPLGRAERVGGLARGPAGRVVRDEEIGGFGTGGCFLVRWLLVYDSDFGRLPLFDEMLMIP